jgi:hypothetical protein
MTKWTLLALSLEVLVLVSSNRAVVANALTWWAPCSEWADLLFYKITTLPTVVPKITFQIACSLTLKRIPIPVRALFAAVYTAECACWAI